MRAAPHAVCNTAMARMRSKAWVQKKDKTRTGPFSRPMLFTWFMLASLILLFSPQSLTDDLQLAFARIFSWPLTIGQNISLYTRTWRPAPGAKFEKESQYQNYIANLEQQLRLKHEEVERLAKLRDRFHALENAGLIMADIMKYTMNGTQNELTINRGRDDGLAKGQFVLGDNSIIGTITDVSPRTSNVRLFTDPAAKIAVRIGNLKIDRVMQGAGNNMAKIRLLPTKYKVKVADLVFAQKKPGFLDAPMVIGSVAQCKRDDQNPSVWDITVKPVSEIDKLNSVTGIIMNPKK
jgi:rod shape-determining protein MreC